LFTLEPDYEEGWYLFYRYARLAYKLNKFSIANIFFKKSLPLIPKDYIKYAMSAYTHLGHIGIKDRDFKATLKSCKQAFKRSPDFVQSDPTLLLNFSNAYFGLDKYRKAIKYAKKAMNVSSGEKVTEVAYFILFFSYGIKGNEKNSKYFKEKLRLLKPDSKYLDYF
jgi:tetratricopeptide (TPR) repeat protein